MGAPLAAACAVDLDKGHAVVDADEKIFRAVAPAEDDGVGLHGGRLDPGRPGHGRRRRPRRASPTAGMVTRRLAVEPQAGADERAVDRGDGDFATSLPLPVESCGGRPVLGEMIDEHGVGIVGALGVGAARRGPRCRCCRNKARAWSWRPA